MKRAVVPFLFILLYSSKLDGSKTSESIAPLAIKGVIDGYFAINTREIGVVNFGVKNGEGVRTIEKVLKLENQSIAVKHIIDGSKLSSKRRLKIGKPSILLFDSLENFKQYFPYLNLQPFGIKKQKLLIFIPRVSMKEIEIYFNFMKIMADQIDFLVNDTQNSIELVTASMFSRVTCFKNQWKVANRFMRVKNRWENSNFFVEKFNDLNKCALKVQFYSVYHQVYDFMAAQMNATIFGLGINERQSRTFSIESLSTGDLARIGSFTLLNIEPRTIYIPPGELYGDFEKMLLPFDLSTWCGILLITFVSSCAIFTIKKFSLSNQKMFFGRDNNSPFMNFIDILLNGAQPRSFIENVPRIFLMTFVFWSLIFR
jgi:hypothetical protein